MRRENLHDYQVRGVEFIKDVRRCAMILDLGLGKTITTLTAITDILDGFDASRVLIIAPLRVANSVWKQEAARWDHTQHLRVAVCTGGEKKRIAGLMSGAEVCVINRENVEWLVNHYGKKWPFDAIIIDESSSFKSPSARRFKALRKVTNLARYVVLLTGTPAPNGLLDLWAQYFLIDQGDRLGKTITSYKQRFFESDYMGYTFKPRQNADAMIHALLSDVTLSMTAEDYLELPERVDVFESLPLPPAAMKQYAEFERDLLIEISDDEVIEASSAAVLAGRLLQWCNGAIYTDDFGNWHELHKVKLDALAEIIADNAGESVLVAYNFKHDLLRLQARFPHGVALDKNPETIERWNNGEISLLFAHPASAGHGINLQAGGAIIVWFGLNWSLEYYQQFNGRLHRQGQTKPVRIIHLVAEGCLDDRVVKTLADKSATQQDLIENLKRK